MRRALVFALLLSVLPAMSGAEGTISANKLNVRVKPGTKYEVVARLDKGHKVNVLKHENEWYMIAAPPETRVFVARSFVEGGRVVKEAHLRAGPSVAFTSYRTALPGEKIDIIDDSREDWLQIVPPSDIMVWVNAQYVYLTPESAAELAEKQKPVEEPPPVEAKKVVPGKPVAADAGTAKVPPDTASVLPFTDEKGKQVSVEGTIVPLKDSLYVTHAVAVKVSGEYFPLCYIRSEQHDLKSMEGIQVNVIGSQRWVKNWKRPVVEVEKIRRLE